MESVSTWKSRADRAQAMQSRQHDEWNKAKTLLDCQYFNQSSSQPSNDRVDVNFVNWYISNLVPLVYFRDPYLFFKSKTDSWQRFAETLEKVVNTYWKDLKLKQQFKRVILSAFLQPPGWIYVGYTAKIEEDVAKHDDNQEKGLIKSIKDILRGKNGTKDEKLPEEKGVLNQSIKEESLFATWIPSWNVLMPAGYQLVGNMPWLIWYEDVPMIDFMKNPMWKNKNNIKGYYQSEDSSEGRTLKKVSFDSAVSPSDINDELTLIRLFHVWDRRSQRRGTFSMQCDDWHFEGDWPYDMSGFPLKELTFEETIPGKENNTPYPYNIIRPILPQVEEQSNARTQMSRWRSRASAFIIADKGSLTESDMNQLENSDAMQIVYLSNIAGIQMATAPALPQGVFQVDDVIKQDLQMATNMGQLMFQAQEGQRTATQAQIAQTGLQLKISAKQDVIEDFTVEVGRALAQLAWQFLDRDQVSELIGEEVSAQMWPDLPKERCDRRRIIQNMKVFIDSGAAAPPKDETVDRKQLLDFLSFAAAFAPERIKKDEALKAGMLRWKFIKDVDKIVITNDQGEIDAATEENSLMATNIPCIVSPNNNHVLHLQEHAKAPPTTSRDQHMLDHAQYAGLTPGQEGGGQQAAQQGAGPQAGDSRFPAQSTNPEMTRQGNPSGPSIMQSAQNKGPGSSTNKLVPTA